MAAYIPAGVRQEVRGRAQQRCEYCQSPEWLTGLPHAIDHITPRRLEGASNVDNLCLACSSCNGHKQARTAAIDPESGETVPLYHPRRQRWPEHFAWSADGKYIIGLTATGRATIAALQMNRPTVVTARSLWVDSGQHPPR